MRSAPPGTVASSAAPAPVALVRLVLGGQRAVARVGGEQRGDGLAQRSGGEDVGQLQRVEPGGARGGHVRVGVRLPGDETGDDRERGDAVAGGGVGGQRHARQGPAGPGEHAAPVRAEGVERGGHVGGHDRGPAVARARREGGAAAVARPVERQQPDPGRRGERVVGVAGEAGVGRAVEVEDRHAARVADVVDGHGPAAADRQGAGGHGRGS